MSTMIDQTSKEYFRVLKILHIGLIMGPLMFMLSVYLITMNQPIDVDKSMADTMLFLAIGAVFIGLVGAFAFQSSQLKLVRQEKDLLKKMSRFRTIMVVVYALMEMPSIVIVVAFLFGSTPYVLILGVITISVLISQAPGNKYVIRKLQLNKDEIKLVNDPKAIICQTAPKQTD